MRDRTLEVSAGPVMSLLLCAMTVACHGRAEPAAAASHLLHGTPLVSSRMLGNPRSLAVVGPYLVVVEDADTVLHWFDRKTGARVWAAGRQGSGPGELKNILSLQPRAQGDSSFVVWAYDRAASRITGFGVKGAGPPQVIGKPVMLQPLGAPTAVGWITDSLLVASGLFTTAEGRIYVLNRAGVPVRTVGTIPLVTGEVSPIVAQQILQPSTTIHPGGELVALAALYIPRVDIYSLTDGNGIQAKVPLFFEPEIRIEERGEGFQIFAPTMWIRLAYVDIAGTENLIYVLFSGRTRAQHPLDASLAPQVHVFTWTGELVGVLDLGQLVKYIAVSPDDLKLYAVTQGPEPGIAVYDLTGVSGAAASKRTARKP